MVLFNLHLNLSQSQLFSQLGNLSLFLTSRVRANFCSSAISNVLDLFLLRVNIYKHPIMVVFAICYKVKTQKKYFTVWLKKININTKRTLSVKVQSQSTFLGRFTVLSPLWCWCTRWINYDKQHWKGEETDKRKEKKRLSGGVSTNSVWDCSQFGTWYNLNKGAKCNRDLVTNVKWVQMFQRIVAKCINR